MQEKRERKRVPKSVNSQENSRVEASMIDNLRLSHLQSLRHPVQESKIRLEFQINELAHKVPRPPGAASSPIDVPLGKVNSVIDGLNSQQSKSQQKCKSR